MKDFIDTALNGLFIIALPIFNACSRTDSEVLFSPDGKLEVSFSFDIRWRTVLSRDI